MRRPSPTWIPPPGGRAAAAREPDGIGGTDRRGGGADQPAAVLAEGGPHHILRQGRRFLGRLSLLFAISVAMLLYFTIMLYGQNVLRSVIEGH
ncbi:MAG: hypothetical protein IPF98_25240 [Gemmatimonadetes bacterium]|nr:hypothetical protein [Gemmatimonadota bacterium]